jgi:hypothetical protein
MADMKIEIERALADLIGEALIFSNRAADMEMFHFGARHEGMTRGRPERRRDHALHVQCYWRLVGPDGIVAGYHDLTYPAGDDPGSAGLDFNYEQGNRRDERLARFYDDERAGSRVVEAVTGDSLGGVRISLSRGHALEVIPCDSLDTEGVESERWRFFETDNPSRPHFVVEGRRTEFHE